MKTPPSPRSFTVTRTAEVALAAADTDQYVERAAQNRYLRADKHPDRPEQPAEQHRPRTWPAGIDPSLDPSLCQTCGWPLSTHKLTDRTCY